MRYMPVKPNNIYHVRVTKLSRSLVSIQEVKDGQDVGPPIKRKRKMVKLYEMRWKAKEYLTRENQKDIDELRDRANCIEIQTLIMNKVHKQFYEENNTDKES